MVKAPSELGQRPNANAEKLPPYDPWSEIEAARMSMQLAAGPDDGSARSGSIAPILIEQLGKLVGHGAAELLGVDDRDGALVIAGDVVADANGDELDRRAALDIGDDLPQVLFKIVAGIHRQRRVVDRRAVGDHHQDAALVG